MFGMPQTWPWLLGALAVFSGLSLTALDLVFAIKLLSSSSTTSAYIIFFMAAVMELIATVLFITLLGRQVQHRNEAHLRAVGRGKQYTYILIGISATIATLGAVATAASLGIVQSKVNKIPNQIASTPSRSLIIVGFVVWAVALLTQSILLVCIIMVTKRNFQRQIQMYQSESLPQIQPKMTEASRRPSLTLPEGTVSRAESMEPDSSFSSNRSRSASVQSSITQVVRPITSKTRLIPGHQRTITTHHRGLSTESVHQESPGPAEETFDSWDTSAVEPPTRQVMESVSPSPPRFLETIPQSPAGSRAPSPGLPLELNLPKIRKRSMSFSPSATSPRESAPTPRPSSPADSIRGSQAHIHPLFRAGSPSPPSLVTPGTMLTAAPDAGVVISNRHSIKSIHRIWSESRPSSPLLHSTSLDNLKRDLRRDECGDGERNEGGFERKLTPPVPDWILGVGSRDSVAEHSKRKVSPGPPIGIGTVGEAL